MLYFQPITMSSIKKETSRRPRNQHCTSEVLALAIEALVPLRHRAVNSCLVKFPGLRYEPVPQVLLDVIVRDESFAPQAFLGDQKWRNRRERGLDCMEGDRESPTWISASHVTCTHDHLAAGSELPRSCRNHSLLHKQQYWHRFVHSRLRLVSFIMSLIYHSGLALADSAVGF